MLNDIQRLIVQIIGNSLFSDKCTLNELKMLRNLPERDLILLLEEAKQQAVFPIIFTSLKDYLVSFLQEDDFKKYERSNSFYIVQSIRNLNDHNKLHRFLTVHGIKYVILKGQASAEYYPEPMLREAGDVDFIVSKIDLAKVDSILINKEFKKKDDKGKHLFHWAYYKNRTVYEMHWKIPGLPQDDSVVSPYISTIFDDAVLRENQNGSFMVPSRFHHGLILLLHALSHLTSTGMGLRHLLDWLVFENSLSEEEFISLFKEPLVKIGIWKCAKVFTRIGTLYFGCKDRLCCRDVDEWVCTGILEDIFSAGNLGGKDNGTRKLQAKLIRNTKTRKIEKVGLLKNVVDNFNAKANQYFPLSKKCPLLLPIGWGIVVNEYIKWTHTDKGKMIDKDLYKDAINRQKLYSELRLFE